MSRQLIINKNLETINDHLLRKIIDNVITNENMKTSSAGLTSLSSKRLKNEDLSSVARTKNEIIEMINNIFFINN